MGFTMHEKETPIPHNAGGGIQSFIAGMDHTNPYPTRGVTPILSSLAKMKCGVAPRIKGRRVHHRIETLAIQEGAPAVYGQAHQSGYDPTDQDGLESIARGNVATSLQNVAQSATPQPVEMENRVEIGLSHQMHGDIMFQPAPALVDIAHFLQADEGTLLPIEIGPFAQSASGFSEGGMNVPSTGHLRQVLPTPRMEFQLDNQASGGANDDIELKREHVRKRLLDCNIDLDVINGVVYEFGQRSLESYNEFFKYLDLKEQRHRRNQPRPEFVEIPAMSEGTTRPFATGPQNIQTGPSSLQENRTSGSQPQPLPRETFPAPAQDSQQTDSRRMRHPNFRDIQTRSRSFQGWPKSSTQCPENLAAAGLFYTGNQDQCCCFHCGKILMKWEPGDDPLTEHARWYPDCPYLKEANNAHLTMLKSQEGAAGVEEEMENLAIEETDKYRKLLDMGFKREDVINVTKKIGKKAELDEILDELTKQASATDSMQKGVKLPPEIDPNVCGVCNKDPVSVTQLKCCHIVCRKCVPKRDADGMYWCGICKKEVTKTIAYDSGASN